MTLQANDCIRLNFAKDHEEHFLGLNTILWEAFKESVILDIIIEEW